MLAVLCQNTRLQIINTIVTLALVVTNIQGVNVLNKSSGHVSNIKEIYQLPGHACIFHMAVPLKYGFSER